jgi:RNA polymerase sigma-70 factor (ECF subfamily)
MSEPELHTTRLHGLLDRIQSGEGPARDELLRLLAGRLECMARYMLRRFPGVRRWEETGDVLQNASLRLLRSLQQVRPGTMRDFFNLAAVSIRRELLNLARHYQGPHGLGTRQVDGPREVPEAESVQVLDRWSAFHEAVEQLPAEEREVFGLVFYHGWTQAQIGELFQVTERTVRRHWQSACLKLNDLLDGDMPPP